MATDAGAIAAGAVLGAGAVLLVGMIAFAVAQPLHVAWRILDAQSRFAPAQAVVVSSAVQAIHGRQTSYRPLITYRYAIPAPVAQAPSPAPAGAPLQAAGMVAAGVRIGRTFQFMLGSMTAGEAWSSAVCARYPPGQRITVWYDPVAPEIALIERSFPPGLTAALLCLQIFVAALAMVIYAVWYLIRDRLASRRCRAGSCAAGWVVPRLGRMRVEQGVLALGGGISPARLLGWVALGYAVACLGFGLLLLGLGGQVDRSWPDQPPAALAAGALALAAGIILAVVKRRTAVLPLLVIDEVQRRIALTAGGRRTEVAWSQIAAWRVRWQRAIAGNPRSAEDDVLYLVDAERREVRIHKWRDRAVAAHVAAQLAQRTGAPCELPAAVSAP